MNISKHKNKKEKLLFIENKKYKLQIPLDYGIRISSLKLKNSNFNFLASGVNVEKRVGNEKWKLRGGHRLWHTPESFPRTYLPDNRSIEYKLNDKTLILSQKLNDKTKVKKEIHIKFIENGKKIQLDHFIINKGMWPIETAAWAITMMNSGGKAVVPLNNNKKEYLSTKSFSVWPYCSLADKRIEFKENEFLVNQDSNNNKSFKIGTNNNRGFAKYIYKDYIFKKEFDYIENKKYPDKGCNFELYTNDKFLELESLSYKRKVYPQDHIKHREIWSIGEKNE